MTDVPPSSVRERLTQRDWIFLAVCAAVFAASLFVIQRWFGKAFPETSIDFRYDRKTSLPIAETLLKSERFDVASYKHTVFFDSDNTAKIFLERTLGFEQANEVMSRDVRLWFWHHRWYRPLQEEELAVDVAPTGEVVSYQRKLPENLARPTPDVAGARQVAESFLTRANVRIDSLQLVSQSERKLPRRTQRIFTWDSKSVRPGGAPYRYVVAVDGDLVSLYTQRIKVPDEWRRGYEELRSKNLVAGRIDLVFFGLTILALGVVFVIRLRRGDIPRRFILGIGAITVVLVAGVSLNSFSAALASYDTTTSYPAFIAQVLFLSVLLPAFSSAVGLMVVCGAGEVLYREDMPRQLAIPRLWTPRALTSKRVFRSFILGYTLVAFFIAYQTAFYIVADKYGAWSPAEVPYDDILNTAFPWIAVLFAGFLPAFSEEFLSRAFSIPFLAKLLRSRVFAIVLAGFIWGFGHTTYPNQPFYIRGVEVGVAGVVIGFLFQAFGLLPLLIWHYTVDAIYTALLLFRSNNSYYIVSAGAASLIFAIPMLASIVLYFRNGGFLPDDELSNDTIPLEPAPPPAAAEAPPTLPPARRVTRHALVACAVAVIVALLLSIRQPAQPSDVIDYRIDSDEAKAIATKHLDELHQTKPRHVIAAPVTGFRSWNPNSKREDGGAPDGFDGVAAEYLLKEGVTPKGLAGLFRNEIEAATWSVRFFTPQQKEEHFVELDPRTARVVGYHKYQDEKNGGPRLSQDAARAIASLAFRRYGLDERAFDLKEALSFQQPERLDWLFHFEERGPIADDAHRRVTIRVAGAEVTQFAKTIKVPDGVYRAAEQRGVLNFLILLLQLTGAVVLLGIAIAGLIIATRKGRFPWRRAARWTALLSLIPIASAVANFEYHLFGYVTSMQWETFMTDMLTAILMSVGRDVAMIFIALVGIELVYPYAPSLITRDGLRRFGRAAGVAALTAVGLTVVLWRALQLLGRLQPSLSFSVPDEVGIAFPALFMLLDAIQDAVLLSGAVALFSLPVRSLRRKAWLPPLITIAGIFFVSLDGSTTPEKMPLMIVRALLMAGFTWIVGALVLRDHLLAWPATVLLVRLLEGAAALLPNHRADLQWNAALLIAAAIGVLIVLLMHAPRPDEEPPQVVEEAQAA